jgi:GT2 family glycosyltransferase
METPELKAALIIPTYGRPKAAEILLQHLALCAFPSNVIIYVIENGPPAGVEAVCNVNTVGNRVRYLHSPIAGVSVALNLAIRSANQDFFIFFHDDIKVPTNTVASYIAAAARYGPGHFFGGPWIADAESSCPKPLLPHLPLSARGWSLGEQEIEVDKSLFNFFCSMNWGAFRGDLLKAGLFDEDLGVGPGKYSPVSEESELQQRLIAIGVRPVYLPQAIIRHSVKSECYTVEWIRNRHFRHGITDWIIRKKYGPIAAFTPENWEAYEFLGVPWGAVMKYCKQTLKQMIAPLLSFPLERRLSIKFIKAYWAGWLYGATTRRKVMTPLKPDLNSALEKVE